MRERPYPGMTLMLDAKLGGYDEALGFAPDLTKLVPVLDPPADNAQEHAPQGDHLSLHHTTPVTLADHLREIEQEATELTDSLGLSDEDKGCVKLAARWHAVGKSHPAFQTMLLLSMGDEAGPWGDTLLAKDSGSGRRTTPSAMRSGRSVRDVISDTNWPRCSPGSTKWGTKKTRT